MLEIVVAAGLMGRDGDFGREMVWAAVIGKVEREGRDGGGGVREG